MRTGFHTNAFVWAGVNDIEQIASFAAETGFDFLEVGPGIALDEAAFSRAAEEYLMWHTDHKFATLEFYHQVAV